MAAAWVVVVIDVSALPRAIQPLEGRAAFCRHSYLLIASRIGASAIRIPAHFCGVVVLVASFGRVPYSPVNTEISPPSPGR